ncbi:MAG: hypothetical protein ACQEXJ_25040 [Myxococcota bacterium]
MAHRIEAAWRNRAALAVGATLLLLMGSAACDMDEGSGGPVDVRPTPDADVIGGDTTGSDGAGLSCEGENPEGCQTADDCAEGETCVEAGEGDPCAPSSCFCDEATDDWICTGDCGGGVCEPDEPEPGCEEPNPEGCYSESDCADGEVCNVDAGCFPSSCSCLIPAEGWTCTADCAGGACEPDEPAPACDEPSPAGCTSKEDCDDGEVCNVDAGCFPSSCFCDEATGDWICTDDCGGGVCAPDEPEPGCDGPNPAGCTSKEDCDDGEICNVDAGCFSSSCFCDEATGSWSCTEDCGGGACEPDEPAPGCDEPSPAGCTSKEDCDDGEICNVDAGCFSSSCFCDEATGSWSCTKDCGGGACEPDDGVACPDDQVSTVEGCMTCSEALGKVDELKKEALETRRVCEIDADCTLTGYSTDCAGACFVAVATKQEGAFDAALAGISEDYCGGYADVCGYATPGCLAAEPSCVEGVCEAEYSEP